MNERDRNTLMNRLSGAFFAFAGGVLLLVIIPAEAETVGYGWIRPQTIPNAMAAAIAVAGLALAVRPRGETAVSAREALRAGLFLALLAAGLWLLAAFGFVAVAPVLALILMLAIGERRPYWLAAGALGTPLVIWLVVAAGLGRTLP